jgi:ribosome-associated toxin RatA of RatAB toxin-antitoxin module
MRTEYSQLVRAPRERVFQALTDYEAIPTWDRVMFKRVTVTERGPNTATLDADVRFMGLKMRRTERHVLTPPEKIEVDGSVRDAINTTVWTLRAAPEGTILTALLEVEFKGLLKLLQPLAERQMRNVLPEWMREFASHVEAQQSN